MWHSTTEVEADLITHVAAAAHGIQRTGEIVFSDWTPFRLVSVEQRSRRPAFEHPRQLPPEVEPVGYCVVHAGTAARSHPVSGIPNQECVAGPEVISDCRREGESPLIEYAYRQVQSTRGSPNPSNQLISTQVSAALDPRIPAKGIDPAVTLTGRQKRTGSGFLGHVDPVTVAA